LSAKSRTGPRLRRPARKVHPLVELDRHSSQRPVNEPRSTRVVLGDGVAKLWHERMFAQSRTGYVVPRAPTTPIAAGAGRHLGDLTIGSTAQNCPLGRRCVDGGDRASRSNRRRAFSPIAGRTRRLAEVTDCISAAPVGAVSRLAICETGPPSSSLACFGETTRICGEVPASCPQGGRVREGILSGAPQRPTRILQRDRERRHALFGPSQSSPSVARVRPATARHGIPGASRPGSSPPGSVRG
jgi:hypothetical protein